MMGRREVGRDGGTKRERVGEIVGRRESGGRWRDKEGEGGTDGWKASE